MNIDLKLNQLLSFKGLVLGWIAALSLKYFLYGLNGFNQHWIIKAPSFWNHFQAYMDNVLTWQVLGLIVASALLDHFLWPYFFRQEVQELRSIHED